METNIKAICFDLDGVYFTQTGKKSFHQALSEEFGANPEVVDDLMYRSDAMSQLVRGKMSSVDFLQHLRASLNLNITDSEIIARWVRDYEIDNDVRGLVLEARRQGYKTCVCTNNNAIRLPALEEKFGFYADFDCVISSYEIGYCKPDPEIFQAVLDCAGVEPQELIYSDDNPDRLAGAAEMGIRTFVLENVDQFIKELAKLDIDLQK